MKSIDKWLHENHIENDTDGIRLVFDELKEIAPHIEWEILNDRVYATNLTNQDIKLDVHIVNVVYGYKVLYICFDFNGSNGRYEGISTFVEDIDDLKKDLQQVIDRFNIKTTGIVRTKLF
jgi:hypothetical protein